MALSQREKDICLSKALFDARTPAEVNAWMDKAYGNAPVDIAEVLRFAKEREAS